MSMDDPGQPAAEHAGQSDRRRPDPSISTHISRAINEATAMRESEVEVQTAAGQHRINLIWELTQATVAVAVIGVVLFVNAHLAVSDVTVSAASGSATTQLDVLAGIIVGFYFGRTNHQRPSGVKVRPGMPGM